MPQIRPITLCTEQLLKLERGCAPFGAHPRCIDTRIPGAV